MNRFFFEQLEQLGLLVGGTVDLGAVGRCDFAQLVDLAHESAEITSAEHLSRETSIFAHSASLSLGGGRDRCNNVGCRQNSARELAEFALLYSDRVYVHNFLARHAVHEANNEAFKRDFAEDLMVLSVLRPVIETGVVVPYTPPQQWCPHCLVKASLGPSVAASLLRAQNTLNRELFANVDLTLRHDELGYSLKVRGPSDLVDHGGFVFAFSDSDEVEAMPRLAKQARDGKRVVLSKWACRKLEFHKYLADKAMCNLAFEIAASETIRTSVLTDFELDIRLLNEVGGDPRIANRNIIAQRHLTSMLPFVGDLSLADLRKLRETESDSFVVYRQSLTRAINEYKQASGEFTEATARELYSDVVAPALAKLDAKVTLSRRSLRRQTGARVAGWTAAITFGTYAGFVPPDLIVAAKALGLTQVLAELISSFGASPSDSDELREDGMYFLWRVKQSAESR